jgi:hypothetical protein
MVSGFHAKGTSREFIGIEIQPDPATGNVSSGSIVSVTPAPEPISKVSSWNLHMYIFILMGFSIGFLGLMPGYLGLIFGG